MQISLIDQDKHDKGNFHDWLDGTVVMLGLATLLHMGGQSNAEPSAVELIQ